MYNIAITHINIDPVKRCVEQMICLIPISNGRVNRDALCSSMREKRVRSRTVRLSLKIRRRDILTGYVISNQSVLIISSLSPHVNSSLFLYLHGYTLRTVYGEVQSTH